MILIQSQENDMSTNDIIDWLLYFDKPYLKIYPHKKNISIHYVSIDPRGKLNLKFKSGNEVYSLNDITSYWHRRGQSPVINAKIKLLKDFKSKLGNLLMKKVKSNLSNERNDLVKFINYVFSTVPIKIGNGNNSVLNKLEVLKKATEVELDICNTYVTNSKENLLKIFSESKNIITKSISDNLHINNSKNNFMFYTETINDEFINDLPDAFYYSLFQKQIDKKYEIRTFFLKNKFYSMAIFSQSDEQTTVDFRKYNHANPNRMVPYQLPKIIEEKLLKLMESLSLDSGSIDLILGKDSVYYFLEVNPVGQFGMVSIPCNYYIEKKIANYLSYGVLS